MKVEEFRKNNRVKTIKDIAANSEGNFKNLGKIKRKNYHRYCG